MPERRQAFRREPIEIELDEDTVLSIVPVPWERRTDFGNEAIKQHVQIMNEAVRTYVSDDGLPQLEMKLAEKFSDPRELLRLGLSSEVYEQIAERELYTNQIVEILMAICELNGLDQLKPLLDPNVVSPTTLGGMLSSAMAGNETPKTESGVDSSQPESVEKSSETSPIPNLVPSSVS